MLHYETLHPASLELLKTLMSQDELHDMRLVGGTSLALQYGHRQSVDLDFFGKPQASQDEIIQMAERLGDLMILNHTKSILQMVINGVKVDVVDYSCYEWIDEPRVEDGIVLASTKDIAALKINAIEGRGTKKDFIDVYELLKHYSLSDILGFYSQKYPNYSIFRALLSLTYFEDAETQTMPIMFSTVSWEEIKKQIIVTIKSQNNFQSL
ncbi:MAG: nucleotidyl transferase AbiEii/AbiGii toxin family protein [Bacteroidales bacterium]|nr:nucleotidyl transferase AbiEii/AbiGii toxin family protein [Bacteroidales bacterium]